MSIAIQVNQRRAPGIGASQAAAALGVSPWESPVKLWLKLTGKAEDNFSSAAAIAGVIDEPIIRGLFAQGIGADVFPSGLSELDIRRLRSLEAEVCELLKRPGPEPLKNTRIIVPRESYIHPAFPWLRCTPDGERWERMPDALGGDWYRSRLLSCKRPTVNTKWHWGHPRARTVPPHYRIQSVVEMAVTGVESVDYAVRIDADYFEPPPVVRDLDLEATVLEQLAAFWRLVETDTPPDVDHAKDWREYFADKLPRQRQEIVADPSVEALMDEWLLAWRGVNEANEALETVKNRVLAVAAANNANVIKTDHGEVFVRVSKKDNAFVVAPREWGVEDM